MINSTHITDNNGWCPSPDDTTRHNTMRTKHRFSQKIVYMEIKSVAYLLRYWNDMKVDVNIDVHTETHRHTDTFGAYCENRHQRCFR